MRQDRDKVRMLTGFHVKKKLEFLIRGMVRYQNKQRCILIKLS